MNKDGKKVLDKKWEDSAEGKLGLPPCTNSTSGKTNNFKINCMSTNARSIINKFSEFQVFVDNHAPHLIAITESWCSNSISQGRRNKFKSVGAKPSATMLLHFVHQSSPSLWASYYTKNLIKCITT